MQGFGIFQFIIKGGIFAVCMYTLQCSHATSWDMHTNNNSNTYWSIARSLELVQIVKEKNSGKLILMREHTVIMAVPFQETEIISILIRSVLEMETYPNKGEKWFDLTF